MSLPNFNVIGKIAKQLPKLIKADQFNDWEKKCKNMQEIAGWPSFIFDARAPVFTMDQRETSKQKKRRFECYLVILQCVGREHEDKWQSIIDGVIKADAQALFRKVVKAFSLSGTFGSVIVQRNALQACSMKSTNKRVEAYGLEFIKRVKAVIECGGEVNGMIELVPMYLKGLPPIFKTYIEDIENSIDTKENLYTCTASSKESTSWLTERA